MRVLLALLALFSLACSDDGAAVDGPVLTGQRDGSERWVVFFADDPLDLTAYRSAQKAGAGVREAEEALRDQAAARRKEFAKNLKDLEGVVIEHWYLTNAVTVEIPSGNVGSLRHMAGIKEIRPDRLIE
jgi:hypothetical protein